MYGRSVRQVAYRSTVYSRSVQQVCTAEDLVRVCTAGLYGRSGYSRPRQSLYGRCTDGYGSVRQVQSRGVGTPYIIYIIIPRRSRGTPTRGDIYTNVYILGTLVPSGGPVRPNGLYIYIYVVYIQPLGYRCCTSNTGLPYTFRTPSVLPAVHPPYYLPYSVRTTLRTPTYGRLTLYNPWNTLTTGAGTDRCAPAVRCPLLYDVVYFRTF